MHAEPKTVLKLIGTAALAGVVVVAALSSGAADLPAWTFLIWIAAGFVLLWLAVWWLGGAVSDDPPGEEQRSSQSSDPDR